MKIIAGIDEYTKLLFHMDGEDDGIIFVDEISTPYHKPITAVGNSCTKTNIKKFGTASAYFDGSGDYLSTPLSDDLKFGTGDFTIDCWIYPTSKVATYPVLFENSSSWTSGAMGLFIGYSSITKYRLYVDSATLLITSSVDVIYNEWSHVALVRSGNIFTLYINGTNVGSGSSASSINGVGSLFKIGQNLQSYVDELRISKGIARWTSDFTPPTSNYITDEYTSLLLHCDGVDSETSFLDEVETQRPITLNGNICTKISTKKFGTASAYFDGSGDYLSVANSEDFQFGTEAFTIDCWANFITTGTYATIYENAPAGTNPSYRLLLGFNASGTSDKKLFLRYGTTNYIYNTELNAGQWYHIAVVGETSKITVYLDGQAVINIVDNYNITSQICLIGSINDKNQFWHGYIDELRVSKGIARWTENFTPPIEAYSFSSSETYDETNLAQTVIISQSKSDTQSMTESSKTTLINLTTSQTDTQTYLENQTQQTILSLQQYTESLILGEAGKTQVTLIMQARSDTVINSESIQQIILTNTIGSDILTHNESDKFQVSLVVQSETDEKFAGIILETDLTQNILVSQSISDSQTHKEETEQIITVNQTQNNNQINVETTSQTILVTQTAIDRNPASLEILTQNILAIQSATDIQNSHDEIKQNIIVNQTSNDTQTYIENKELIILTNNTNIDKLISNEILTQTIITTQTAYDAPASIEIVSQNIILNQLSSDIKINYDIVSQNIIVYQTHTDGLIHSKANGIKLIGKYSKIELTGNISKIILSGKYDKIKLRGDYS